MTHFALFHCKKTAKGFIDLSSYFLYDGVIELNALGYFKFFLRFAVCFGRLDSVVFGSLYVTSP